MLDESETHLTTFLGAPTRLLGHLMGGINALCILATANFTKNNMFSFEHPTHFIAIILLPAMAAAVYFYLKKRSERFVLFARPQAIERHFPDFSEKRVWLKTAIFSAGLLLPIIAWANPRHGQKMGQTKTRSLDIFIALDISESNMAQYVTTIFNFIDRPENRLKLFLLAFLAAIFLVKLSLLGSGACSQGDEFRYWYSARMLLAASHGDLVGALAPMFDTAGRPGLALAQLPPVIVQSIVFKVTGLDPRCPDSLLIPQTWNLLLSMVGAWLFFRVGCRVFGFTVKKSAWLTFGFSLLTASTIYLRHLLPYDCAVYLYLWIFLLVFDDKKPFWLGLVSAFAYSVYPGYFPLCGAILLLILYKKHIKPFSIKNLTIPVSWFMAGFISLLIFYEILSRISGKSFIENSLFGGQEFLHFLQLKYDGSFSLLAMYLFQVEGISGLILGVGSIVYFLKIGAKFARRAALDPLDLLAIGLLLGFVFQASIGQVSGMKVFYGRLFRPISMTMVWLAGVVFFDLLEKIGHSVFLKNVFSIIVVGSFLLHFAFFWNEFRQVGYPRDMFYAFGLSQPTNGEEYDIRSKTSPADGLRREETFTASSYFTLPPENILLLKIKRPVDSSLLFINFAAVPVPAPRSSSEREYPRVNNFVPLILKNHYAGFAPYFFEEDPNGRIGFLDGRPLKIGIFKDKKLAE